MDFDIPRALQDTLARMDAFIAAEILPLEQANIQFFDHRREQARTNWDAGGVPTAEWEELLSEMRRRADAAGWLIKPPPGALPSNRSSGCQTRANFTSDVRTSFPRASATSASADWIGTSAAPVWISWCGLNMAAAA